MQMIEQTAPRARATHLLMRPSVIFIAAHTLFVALALMISGSH